MKYFKGCTALITGASSGLGEEMARQLAPHAKVLILVARRLDRLDSIKAELSRDGLTIYSHKVDLADMEQTEQFLVGLDQSELQVNLLINNAGLGDRGPFENSDWTKVQKMLDVNICALKKFTHQLLPMMRGLERAAIVNVSSIASLIPIPSMAVYAATKAYVTSFSEALRAELRGTGISVTAVCPGPVETEFDLTARRESAIGVLIAPQFFKVSARQVVKEALNAVARDRARVIPGTLVAIVMTMVCILPVCVLRLFLNRAR